MVAFACVPPWQRPGLPKPAPRGFGAALGYGLGGARELDAVGAVWYLDYGYRGKSLPDHPRLFLVNTGADLRPVVEAAQRERGEWWQFGNEPNDPNQDAVSPSEYARRYHDFYFALKRADPTALIVSAGIADADWGWAEAFREAYRTQFGRYPRVDGWNIHNYLLGGCASALDVSAFQKRILAFRRWMEHIGDVDKPLFLTEYGILYGNGCCGCHLIPPEAGTEYMRATTRWLMESGTVQAWAWFAVQSGGRFNGDLVSPDGELTPYGATYRELGRP